MLRQQNPDGDWPQWFMFFERERNIRPGDSHGDIVYWPVLALASLMLVLGWGADALGLVLGAARMQATRWAYIGSGLGLLVGLVGLLPALPLGGPLLGALVGPLLGAAIGELLSAPTSLGPLGLLRLKRSLLVGLAVVAGMLVSRFAQFLLSLVGVLGFVLLSTGVLG
ncbi:MAG: DUF456 family protein [Cyanobium sp. ELA712]